MKNNKEIFDLPKDFIPIEKSHTLLYVCSVSKIKNRNKGFQPCSTEREKHPPLKSKNLILG